MGDCDELPTDLIETGEFEDQNTAFNIQDEVGKLSVPWAICKRIDGERERDKAYSILCGNGKDALQPAELIYLALSLELRGDSIHGLD